MKCIVCLTLFYGVQVQAQAFHAVSQTQSPDLKTLTQVVLQHNPQHLAVLETLKQAQAGIISASAWPNPRLEVGQGSSQARMPGAVGGSLNSVGLIQPIENPALRTARVN